jgi:hypothetical protein
MGHKILLGLSDDPSYGQPNADFVDLANFISTLASDDFNRADGSLGKNWFTFGSVTNAPQVKGNVATIPSIAAGTVVSLGQGLTLTSSLNQMVSCVITHTAASAYNASAPTNAYTDVEVVLRANVSTGDCIFVHISKNGVGTSFIRLMKRVSGVDTVLNQMSLSVTNWPYPVHISAVVKADKVYVEYFFIDNLFANYRVNSIPVYTLSAGEITQFSNAANQNCGIKIVSNKLHLLKDSEFAKVTNLFISGGTNSAFSEVARWETAGTLANGWVKHGGGATDWTVDSTAMSPALATKLNTYQPSALDTTDGITSSGQLIIASLDGASGSLGDTTYWGHGLVLFGSSATSTLHHWVRFYQGKVWLGRTDGSGNETLYTSASLPAFFTPQRSSFDNLITVFISKLGVVTVLFNQNVLLNYAITDGSVLDTGLLNVGMEGNIRLTSASIPQYLSFLATNNAKMDLFDRGDSNAIGGNALAAVTGNLAIRNGALTVYRSLAYSNATRALDSATGINYNISSQVKGTWPSDVVLTGAPTRAEVLFRALDNQNGLVVTFMYGQIVLYKLAAGFYYILATTPFTTPDNTYIQLGVTAIDGQISIVANGNTTLNYTLTGADLTTYTSSNYNKFGLLGVYSSDIGSTAGVGCWENITVNSLTKYGYMLTGFTEGTVEFDQFYRRNMQTLSLTLNIGGSTVDDVDARIRKLRYYLKKTKAFLGPFRGNIPARGDGAWFPQQAAVLTFQPDRATYPVFYNIFEGEVGKPSDFLDINLGANLVRALTLDLRVEVPRGSRRELRNRWPWGDFEPAFDLTTNNFGLTVSISPAAWSLSTAQARYGTQSLCFNVSKTAGYTGTAFMVHANPSPGAGAGNEDNINTGDVFIPAIAVFLTNAPIASQFTRVEFYTSTNGTTFTLQQTIANITSSSTGYGVGVWNDLAGTPYTVTAGVVAIKLLITCTTDYTTYFDAAAFWKNPLNNTVPVEYVTGGLLVGQPEYRLYNIQGDAPAPCVIGVRSDWRTYVNNSIDTAYWLIGQRSIKLAAGDKPIPTLGLVAAITGAANSALMFGYHAQQQTCQVISDDQLAWSISTPTGLDWLSRRYLVLMVYFANQFVNSSKVTILDTYQNIVFNQQVYQTYTSTTGATPSGPSTVNDYRVMALGEIQKPDAGYAFSDGDGNNFQFGNYIRFDNTGIGGASTNKASAGVIGLILLPMEQSGYVGSFNGGLYSERKISSESTSPKGQRGTKLYGSNFRLIPGDMQAVIAPFAYQTGSTNEVQAVTITGTPTGGTFTLSYNGQTTTALAGSATASVVQAALEALPSIGVGNVVVTGGPGPGTPYTLTFQNTLGAKKLTLLIATGAFTGGSSPAIAITETTVGKATDLTNQLLSYLGAQNFIQPSWIYSPRYLNGIV